MPANTIKVARPSKHGNPFKTSDAPASCKTDKDKRAWAVGMYELRVDRAAADELRGKNLACFCPLDQPCHADVLLKWANEEHQDAY